MRAPEDAPAPPDRDETSRERLRALLLEEPATARDLSQRAQLSERDVQHHLEHLARSSRARGERFVVEPAACIGCGFVFAERDRVAKPGRCPDCRGTRISPPRFRLER